MRVWYTFVLYGMMATLAQAQNWTVGNTASWIRPDSADQSLKIKDADIDGGFYYTLVDEQVNAGTKEYYYHYIYKIVNDAGVQNASELNFDFNPAFQSLMVNTLRVYRKGQVYNRLDKGLFKALQREPDLEKHMYDNTIALHAVLGDIRAGDVVEYAYTIKGDNPIFKNKFYFSFSLHDDDPLLKVHERVLKPKNLELYTKYYLEDKRPEIREVNGQTEEWEWTSTNVPRYKVDKDIPRAYRSWPKVEITEYKDWKGVADWAQEIFRLNYKTAGIAALASTIRQTHADSKNRIIAALRFVQNQVRYYGFEIGINAIKPHLPDYTFEKRFGDCKDKAVLFCALLKEMGIDSCYPVLVNSGRYGWIDGYAPSPHVFNHAIACVRLDGVFHFFDPTASYEGGDFEHTYTTDYQKGLIIWPYSTDLATLPRHVVAKTEVNESIRVHNMDGKADVKIVTAYYGNNADNERYRYANNSIADIKEGYINYYKKKYDHIESTNDPEINDDTIANVFTVTETYTSSCIWDTTEDHGNKRALFLAADDILTFTGDYNEYDPARTMPVGLGFPKEFMHHVTVDLPEAWDIKDDSDVFNSKFIKYTRNVHYQGTRLEVSYAFSTLQPICDSKDAKILYKQLGNIKDNNWYKIYHVVNSGLPAESNSAVNWLMVLMFLLSLLLSLILCIILYLRHRISEPLRLIDPDQPHGIGGWLILPMLSLFISPLGFIYFLFSADHFEMGYWNYHTSPDSIGYSALWAPVLLLEMCMRVFMVVFDVICIIMLFRFDYRFPKYMITRIIIFMAYGFLSAAVQMNVDGRLPGISSIVSPLIAGAIWIPYFLVSKRVHNTYRQ